MDNSERYTVAEGLIYDRGYHDGAIDAKKNLDAKFDEKLNDLVGNDAYYELSRTFEMERKTEVYEAWERISHYVKAMCHLIEAEAEISERTKMLAKDIKHEVEQRFLSASDDYYEIIEIQEAFAEECRKSAERGRA